MKKWENAELLDLNVKETAESGWDNKNHKGNCEMHKNPGSRICTCGANTDTLS